MESIRHNELYHYGVLGMKWGVRRFQPYGKDYKGSGKEVGEAKKKSKAKFDYDDDIVIKKGTKAYRISANKTDTNDRRYVTVDQNDRNFYKGMWPSTMKGAAGIVGKDAKIYEHKYKTTEDLISPSAKKREKIASDLLNDDEVIKEIVNARLIASYRRSQNWSVGYTKQVINYWENNDPDFIKYQKDTIERTRQDVVTRSERDRAVMLLQSMGNSDKIKMKFGEAVVKEGYNMVIDDHGADFAGNRQRVNAPIIVLQANKALEQIGSTPVSKLTSTNAMSKYANDVDTIPGFVSEKYFVPNVIKGYYGTKNYYNNNTYDYIYDSNNQRIKNK